MYWKLLLTSLVACTLISCSKDSETEKKFFLRFTENDTAREFTAPILSSLQTDATGGMLVIGALENQSSNRSMTLSIYNDHPIFDKGVYSEAGFLTGRNTMLLSLYIKHPSDSSGYQNVGWLPLASTGIPYKKPYDFAVTLTEVSPQAVSGSFSGTLYFYAKDLTIPGSSFVNLNDSVVIKNGVFRLPGVN